MRAPQLFTIPAGSIARPCRGRACRESVYDVKMPSGVWHAAQAWAIANGENPELRIALCGYDGAPKMPSSWSEVPWRSAGGYGRSKRGRANRDRERVWFSPHCLLDEQAHLFDGAAP